MNIRSAGPTAHCLVIRLRAQFGTFYKLTITGIKINITTYNKEEKGTSQRR